MKRIRFQEDPKAEREAEKYERPIPSREFIMQALSENGRPMTMTQLLQVFSLKEDEDVDALGRRLRAMVRDGQLVRNRRDGYGLVDKMDLLRGRVVGHPDGFGFLVPDEGGEDLFLSAKRMRGLLHGDRIVARVAGLDFRGRKEGAPVEVLERANHQVVGRFRQEHGVSFLEASNKRISQAILIPPEARGAAIDGQIAVAEIVEQPTWRTQPIGRVVEVLGDHMAPGMEIDVAIRSYEIPSVWPGSVVERSGQFSTEVPEAAKQGREDLREIPLVTIDGEDARDFDDAVFCERRGRGWRLLVAIADVSAYVMPYDELDKEAQKRGNSVYFPGRVVPMLPEVLSNGLCSLNPLVDRLCMVCEMIVGASGNVRSYRFLEGVMRSHARLTYNEVAAMVVDRKTDIRRQYKLLMPHLEELHNLYKVLQQRRQKRGAIEFDRVETRILFGAERKIKEIVPVERNDAHRMIEEFMVAANVCAAQFLEKAEIPALYRVHAGPPEEKLLDLRAFLGEFGLKLGGGKNPEPKHYSKLLEQVRVRPDAHLIETVMLRSLSQAVYTPENSGHFGLAFDAYTHFTSPIRRYPDLLVHRAIRHVLGGKPVRRFQYSETDMQGMGEHCSMSERRADDATRDAVDWLKCEYMQDKVGDVHEGRVTAVTSFGLFVELDQIYVEGLVHVSALDNDYYHFDPVKHRLAGERTGEIFRLGDKVNVRVVRVGLDDRKIDFELVRSGKRGAKTGKRESAKRGTGKRRARR